MRKTTLDDGKIVSFFLDGLVSLSIILPIFKHILDNLVDYYRHLLLRNKRLHCPVCLTLYIVKNGKHKRMFGSPVQTYLCRNCGKQFCANIFHRFYRHRYPIYAILLSLDLKKQGRAVTQIMANIIIPFLTCFFQPCYATITRWIKKFGKVAIETTSKIKLKAGRRKHWEIDEQYDSRIIEIEEDNQYVKNGKKKCGTFGIIDSHTKLISIETFEKDLCRKAENMLLRTIYRWRTKPRTVWRDGFNGYDKILNKHNIPYGTVIHNQEYVSKKGHHDNNIEREWVEKKDWIKHCRGFATVEGRAFYDKFYEMIRNFFTPRISLERLTPAQKAGLKEMITFLGLLS